MAASTKPLSFSRERPIELQPCSRSPIVGRASTATGMKMQKPSSQFARQVHVEQPNDIFVGSKGTQKDTLALLLQDSISLEDGELLHSYIVRNGLDGDVFLSNLLVSMYGKFGLVDEACSVFDCMPCRSIVSWSAIISACVQHGQAQKAIALFQVMHQAGVKPNKVTFVRLLTACASLDALEDGQLLHALLVEHGVNIDIVIGTALLSMYGKCQDLSAARHVFSSMSMHDTISWNAIIATHEQLEHHIEAVLLFELLQESEAQPDRSTLLSALAAYASTNGMNAGRLIHGYIINTGLDSDLEVANALIHIYGMSCATKEADFVFNQIQNPDVVSWNSIIAAKAQRELFREAFDLFQQMLHEHVMPTRATFLNILGACAAPEALSVGKSIHAHISQSQLDSDLPVATALIEMYGKCGATESARLVFNEIDRPDGICWNTIIACFAQQGQAMQALQMFQSMLQKGFEPDKITCCCILSAFSALGYLLEGKLVHSYIMDKGFDADIILIHALMHMYGKCGSLEEARALFDKLNPKELISWNAMISAYAQEGHGAEAINLYERLLQEGLKPDGVTFVNLLSACNHTGLVERGLGYYISMHELHHVMPSLEHHICLVDLFRRAGCLDVAQDLIHVMPCKATSVVWSALLGGYGLHDDVEHRAKHAAKELAGLS